MTTDAQRAPASLTSVRDRENRMYLAVFMLAFPPLFLAAMSRRALSRRVAPADAGEQRRSIVHEAASDARSALSIALGLVARK